MTALGRNPKPSPGSVEVCRLWLDKWLETLAKAGVGIILTVLAAWAIGRFNNSLVVKLSCDRQPVYVEGSLPSEDHVALAIQLKKPGPTRVRLVKCRVEIEADAASQDQIAALQKSADQISTALMRDFRVSTGKGIALVPGDEVQFQSHFQVPRNLTLHIKVLLEGKMMLAEWLRFATPDWSSSVVVLPLSPDDSGRLTGVGPKSLTGRSSGFRGSAREPLNANRYGAQARASGKGERGP